MEKTGTACVGVDDTATLTWIEYKLETFATIIKERLSKIVEAKETVSDWDKAAWFTSIVVLLGKVLPANRFLFRIVEEETNSSSRSMILPNSNSLKPSRCLIVRFSIGRSEVGKKPKVYQQRKNVKDSFYIGKKTAIHTLISLNILV